VTEAARELQRQRLMLPKDVELTIREAHEHKLQR
jgi:hypothetical protein